MQHTLTLTIDAPSSQKATALRTRAHELLDQDPDCTVLASQNAKDTTTYTVIGVDTEQAQPFEHQVEAMSEQDARDQYEPPQVVATVTAT